VETSRRCSREGVIRSFQRWKVSERYMQVHQFPTLFTRFRRPWMVSRWIAWTEAASSFYRQLWGHVTFPAWTNNRKPHSSFSSKRQSWTRSTNSVFATVRHPSELSSKTAFRGKARKTAFTQKASKKMLSAALTDTTIRIVVWSACNGAQQQQCRRQTMETSLNSCQNYKWIQTRKKRCSIVKR